MSPKEYAEKFWNLGVFLGAPECDDYPNVVKNPAVSLWMADQSLKGLASSEEEAAKKVLSDNHGIWYRTRVARYRLGPSGEDKNGDKAVNWKEVDGKKDKLYQNNLNNAVNGKKKIKVRVRRIDGVVDTKVCETYNEIALAAVSPFSGKGFPEEVQVCLQLRFRYQKSPFTMEQFVQKDFIGLDCNGFVGGYLRRRNDPSGWHRTTSGWGPSTPIRSLMEANDEKGFLKALDSPALQPPGSAMLLLGMCTPAGYIQDNDGKGGHGHIMITEPNTLRKESGAVSFEVLESTGGAGLVASTYVVKSVSKTGVFLVSRGSKGGETMHVRIRPVA
jgi:hypothetical protein